MHPTHNTTSERLSQAAHLDGHWGHPPEAMVHCAPAPCRQARSHRDVAHSRSCLLRSRRSQEGVPRVVRAWRRQPQVVAEQVVAVVVLRRVEGWVGFVRRDVRRTGCQEACMHACMLFAAAAQGWAGGCHY